MKDYKFENGETVKDKITGFKGVIRGRSDYLTGCNTYGLQSIRLNKTTGKPTDWIWFDEDQLDLVKGTKKIVLNKPIKKKVGGPMSADQFPPSN